MLHFDTAQMAAITQAHFFSRVAEFIRNQTTVAAYRQAASDTTLRTAVWAPHWSALRHACEHDAALFMCFLLACVALGVDATRAAEAVRQSSQPETSMKLFLSERGLLRFSAFDVATSRVPAPRLEHGLLLALLPGLGQGAVRGLLPGRPGEG